MSAITHIRSSCLRPLTAHFTAATHITRYTTTQHLITRTFASKGTTANDSSVKDTTKPSSNQPNDSEYGLGDQQQNQASDRGVKSGTESEAKQGENVSETKTKSASHGAQKSGQQDPALKQSQEKAKHKTVRSKQPHPVLSRRPPTGGVDYSY